MKWVYLDTELDKIISWAIMYNNCNTFFVATMPEQNMRDSFHWLRAYNQNPFPVPGG